MTHGNIQLDGELYIHGKKFQNINSIVSRTANLHPDLEKVEYWIFDIQGPWKQSKRIEYQEMLSIALSHAPNVNCLATHLSTNITDVYSYLATQIKQGFEGIVFRHKDGFYYPKRSTDIMKLKPTRQDRYKISGFHEETSIHGHLKGTLGALVCISDGQHFRVGSGFTQLQREELWKVKEQLIGGFVNIKYKEITNRGVLREPVVVSVELAKSEGR
jgi:ATP-dependent DNA ligase